MIKKIVSGTEVDYDKEFNFTITLTNGNITDEEYDEYFEFNGGKATYNFTLKHNESKAFNLPSNTEGTLESGLSEVIFTNTKRSINEDVEDTLSIEDYPSESEEFDENDTNRDGVVTCEELLGQGWIWDEKTKSCILESDIVIIPPTSTY